MPKKVDHQQRRAEIADTTWRLIAERGIDATTMRAITDALGMANGALKHYFPDKNALVKTAFVRVFDNTNTRIQRRLAGLTGLAALRVFCQEVMPAEDVTELEARVVLPFWQRALADAQLEEVWVEAMAQWRQQLRRLLAEGREEGTIRTPITDDALVEQLLAMLNGAQVLAVLGPDETTRETQQAMISTYLDSLGR